MLIEVSVLALRKAFGWLAWGIIALAAINLAIAIFFMQADPKGRTVLIVGDGVIFALAFGALYILRKQRVK